MKPSKSLSGNGLRPQLIRYDVSADVSAQNQIIVPITDGKCKRALRFVSKSCSLTLYRFCRDPNYTPGCECNKSLQKATPGAVPITASMTERLATGRYHPTITFITVGREKDHSPLDFKTAAPEMSRPLNHAELTCQIWIADK